MQITLHAAKNHLPKLIKAALAGEEVIIAKGKQPVVKLTPVARGQFQIGLLKDQLTRTTPDFLEPMSDEELALWEGAE